jgi:putative ABC transport system permease protein
MDGRFSREVARPRFYMFFLIAFAAAGLLLAAIGIYGVMSYTVVTRTHEFGIRIALGADRHDILRLVITTGARLTCVGATLGLAGALATTRVLSSLLYGIKPNDPLTFICVLMLLLGFALLPCYLAARRAVTVDPSIALRNE